MKVTDLPAEIDHGKPYDRLYRLRGGDPLWGETPGRLVTWLIDNIAPCTVLDAGCGDGKNALHLERAGFRVIGFDHSPAALRALHARFDHAGVPPGGSYRLADACGPRVPVEQVDVLVSYGLYHCLPSPRRRAAHRRLQGLVRPRGLVAFCSLTDGIPMGPEHATPGIELPSVDETLSLWDGFVVHEQVVERFEDHHEGIVPPHKHEGIWMVAEKAADGE